MRHPRRMATSVPAALSLLFVLAAPTPGSATGNIVKSDLKGTWQMTLRGRTACGYVSMLARIAFDTAGVGTGPITMHGDCGDSTLADQTFTVTSLKPNGKGTATLTCGPSCLWHFDMQIAPDRTKFNLADITFTDTDTYIAGVAILSSVADNIVLADLKGEWFAAVAGHQAGDCNGNPFRISVASTLALDDAGAGNLDATLKTNCGNFDDPLNPFTILTLNPDGSGTALLECANDCAITFNIQVSPDRSTMNLVSVSPGDPSDMLVGVAIRRSTGGQITRANLAGPWVGILSAEELDGDVAAALAKFALTAKAKTTNATIIAHDTEGDGTLTGGTFSATINPDGSGTFNVACGTGCTVTYRLQVSPDRSMFSLVDVSATTEDLLIGLMIHQ